MAVAIPWLRGALVSIGLVACSPQLVDVVNGVSCCEDPTQEGCAGSGGARPSGGAGGSGATATGGTATGGASTGGSAGAPATLVHHYTFQGAGIDVTDSVGSANGNVFGTLLDGSGSVTLADTTPEQYVELPSFILNGLKSATFEAWVTWNGVGGPWQRIFDFGEDMSGVHNGRSSGRSYLFFTPNDGTGFPKISFGRPGPNNAAIESTTLVANVAFPQAALTHVAVAVDAGKNSLSLFVNGGFQGASAFNYSLDYIYSVNSWLGRSNYQVDPGFNGAIHDFRIYDGALDANQILANYQRGL